MQGVEHNGHEAQTFLELVLHLLGEFRRSLEPILVTPLQADVLLYRHRDAKLNDIAADLGSGDPRPGPQMLADQATRTP